MANITLLELNLEGATFNAPYAGEGAESEEAETEAPPTEESGGPGKGVAVGALVGLGFLVAVALLAKRRLGGDDELEEETGTTVTLDAD